MVLPGLWNVKCFFGTVLQKLWEGSIGSKYRKEIIKKEIIIGSHTGSRERLGLSCLLGKNFFLEHI